MILSSKILQAFELAHQVHHDQFRKKSSIPYMSHVMGVSSLIMENGGSEEQAIAGLLHDVVEDSAGKVTLKDIYEGFGNAVGLMVEHATDAEEEPKPPWNNRKREYIDNLLKIDDASLLVIACDKYHNLHTIKEDFLIMGHDVWNKFSVPVEKSLWYYTKIFRSVGNRWPLRLSREFQSNLELLTKEYLSNGGDSQFFEKVELEIYSN